MKKISLAIIVGLALAVLLIPEKRTEQDPTENFLEVLKKSNADLQRFTLDNGMICLIKEDHSAPVVSIQFWVGTGAIHEDTYLGAGISHAIEHMIFKGTDKRKPGDISREISDAGGNINAYTGYDRTVFLTDLPSRNWETGLNVLSDALMNPRFPKEEWTQEKSVILREIAMGYDDPNRVINKLLFRTAYRTHPYKYPVIGYEDTFKRINREDLVKFFSKNYVSDNIITIVVGDIDPIDVRKKLIATFADYKRKSRAPVILPKEAEQLSPRFERQTGNYKISRLEWSYHTVPLSHPDAAPLDVLAIILGQGRTSRLSRKIKEELKLAHNISAWSYTPKEAGVFSISAEFAPEKESELLSAMQTEIDSWLKTPFSIEEINKAKRQLLASELSALQTMSGQANNYASGEFYAGDPNYSETYLEQISKTTPHILLKTANKYLVPEHKSLVILSPELSESYESKEQDRHESAPPISKHILSNNIRLIVREDHKLPFVYLCVAGRGGLLSETEQNNGITLLMSELLSRGTSSRTSDEIALASESRGGYISSFSGKNSFGMQAKCLSSDTTTFMELVSDCLINPTFHNTEIEKQKAIQTAAIEANYDRPIYVAQALMRQALFPDHPYQWDELGSHDTIETMSRENIQSHAEKLIVSDNLVISVFGNIKTEQAINLTEKYFSGIAKKSLTLQSPPAPNPDLPTRSKRREPRQQSIVLLGFPGIDVLDKRYDSIALLKDAMSGLSSRLSIEIRDKRGLAYYSGAYNMSGTEPGAFILYAGTQEESVPQVESLMKEEITRLISEGLTDEEVERARNRLISAYEQSLQDQRSISMTCALNELYGLGYDHLFSTADRFNAITAENIKISAQSILSTNKYAMSLVLPERKD